jgi:hypothetical protein
MRYYLALGKQGIGHWALGIGHWALGKQGKQGIGHWALGIGHWAYLTTLENRYISH